MEWIVGHQGNWDEVLMFAVPIAVAIGAVKWAEKRGAKRRAESDSDDKA
jgi:hypothetical protein